MGAFVSIHIVLTESDKFQNIFTDSNFIAPKKFHRIVSVLVCKYKNSFYNLKIVLHFYLISVETKFKKNGTRNRKGFGWHVRNTKKAKNKKKKRILYIDNWQLNYFVICYFSISNDNITACLSANRHGLCIGGVYIFSYTTTGWHWNTTFVINHTKKKKKTPFFSHLSQKICLARGNISQSSSGVLVALLDQAQKLEPQSGPPVLILESSKR